MPPTLENNNTSPVIEVPKDPARYARLVLLAFVMIFTGLLTASYFLNHIDRASVAGNMIDVNNMEQATTTDQMLDWKMYRNVQSGFELKYPPELKVTENNGLVIFSHSIPYENKGDCDMAPGDKIIKDLVDFKISISTEKNSTLPGYTDGNYKSGELNGTYSYDVHI